MPSIDIFALEKRLPIERLYFSGETAGALVDDEKNGFSQDLSMTDPDLLVHSPYRKLTKPDSADPDHPTDDWSAYIGNFNS